MFICRACLKKDKELIDFKNNNNIIQAFFDVANISFAPFKEKVPLSICDQCLTKLLQFTEFRRQIIDCSCFFVKLALQDSWHTEENLDELLQAHWNQKSSIFLDKPADDNTENTVGINPETKELDVVDIKDEFHDLPPTEVFETSFADEFCDQVNSPMRVKKERKKKGKKKYKKSKTPPRSRKNPRTFIEVDPAKITVLELTKEEQTRVQRVEGQKPSFLEMPFKCDKCFKGFNFERKLRSHDESYHKPDSLFACDVCTRTMGNAASLAIHLKKHQFIYQCNACFTKFAEKPRAILHYKSVHEGIPSQFACKHCGKIFNNRSSLNGHLRNHHPESARPQCGECQRSFATKDSLLNHLLIHTGEKSHACPVCDKRFRLRQSVGKHMLSHSSLRAHYCAPCDVSFKSRAALAGHLRHAAAHASPQLVAKAMLQNTCEQCGRGFATRHRLASHAARHAPRPPRPPRPPRTPRPREGGARYVCHHCGRGFAARRTLDNHVLTHSGERPHACPRCDATFAQTATLRAHLARLHAEKTVGVNTGAGKTSSGPPEASVMPSADVSGGPEGPSVLVDQKRL